VIYDIPATLKGNGVTVGIINDSNINVAIPANYRTLFGLAANAPTVIVDGTDPGITADANLAYGEIELLAATAPLAKVNLYTAATTDLDTGLVFSSIRALQDNAVQVLIFGHNACEATLDVGIEGLFGAVWEQAAAQGISVIVGAGSGGAADCDAAAPGSAPVALASNGLAINAYASSPFVTAVGATDFFYGPTGTVNPTNPFASSFANYWDVVNTPFGDFTSAKQYIPEQPSNSSYQATNQLTPAPFVRATGGGVSTLGQGNLDGTKTFYAKPSYQSGFGDSISSTARIVPDVSFFGGNYQNNGSSYMLCILDSDCRGGDATSVTYTADGNSALAAGAFGGIAALLVQAKGAQGNLNPILYATHTAAPAAFHDVTAGTNAVGCTSGSPNCAAGFTNSGTGLAYPATTGYDAASGLGSVDVASFINNWHNPTGAATVTLTLTQPGTSTPIAGSFRHNDPVQLNVTVAGSSAIPTGDVAITTGAPQAASTGVLALPLTDGQAVFSSIGALLPGGTYRLTARFPGDTQYAATSASIPVTVTRVPAGLKVITTDQNDAPLPAFTGQTLTYGSSVHFTFQIYDTLDKNDPQAATGFITLTDNGRQLAILPLNSEGFASFVSSRLASGPHAFNATYSGDPTFSSATLTGPAPSVVIAGAPTSTTLATTASTLSSRNGTLQVVATVAASETGLAGAAPVGSVEISTTGGALLGSAPLDFGNNAGTPFASRSVTITRNKLPAGATSLVATYIPDASGNYAASTSAPLPITINNTPGLVNTSIAITTQPQANTINLINTGNITFVGTVSGGTTPTGTVTFFSNGTPLAAPVAVDATGAASLSVPQTNGLLNLPIGQSRILAQYNGDATHAATSSAYTINVYGQGSTPDFSLQSNSTYQAISASNTRANFTLQLASLNGLSVLGTTVAVTAKAPAGISCVVTPSTVGFNGADYATATLRCTPAAGFTVAKLTPVNPRMLWMVEGGTALACIFLFGMPARRRSWQSLIGSLALIVVAFGITGCGTTVASGAEQQYYDGLNGGSSAANATLAHGNYTVVVTGTAVVFSRTQPHMTVNVVHNLPVKVIVQ
jgi:hypothetical protein